MICKHCGVEIADDAKFCENCGERADGKKICPRCSTSYEGNFCGECGYGEKQKERQKISTVAKTSAIAYLRYVSAGLFALFVILLFVFYTAPAFKLLGESLGNVYEVSKDASLGELQGSAKTLIAVAIVGVFLTVGWFVIWFLPLTKNKRVFGGFLVGDIYTVVGAIYYLLVFIFACVFAGKIKKEELEQGAVTTLVIVFSLCFLLLSVGMTAVWLYFSKELQIDIDGVTHKKDIAPLQKPVAPETVEKPVFTHTAEMDDLCELRIRQCKLAVGVILPLLTFGVSYWLFGAIVKRVNIGNYWALLNNAMIVPIALLISFFALIPVSFVCKVVISGIPYARWNIRKVKNKGSALGVMFCSLAIFIYCLWGVIWHIFFEGGELIDTWYMVGNLLSLGSLAIIYAVKTLKLFTLRRRCKKVLETVNFSDICMEYEKSKAHYQAQQSEYKEFLKKKAQYEYDEKRYAVGKRDAKRICGGAVWLKYHKSLACKVAVLVVVMAVFGGIQIKKANEPNYIFRLEKVAEIRLNDTQKNVEKALGEPHQVKNGYYEYFTEEYCNLMAEIAEIEKSATQAQANLDFFGYEELMLQKETLLEEKSAVKYDYIRIIFDENKKVESVRFEIARCDSAEMIEKACESYYATNLNGSGNGIQNDWQVELYYSDGCYQRVKVSTEETSIWGQSTVYEDEWGSVNLYRKGASSKGFAKGLLIRYELTGDNILYISGRGKLELSRLKALVGVAKEIVVDEGIKLGIYDGIDIPITRKAKE